MGNGQENQVRGEPLKIFNLSGKVRKRKMEEAGEPLGSPVTRASSFPVRQLKQNIPKAIANVVVVHNDTSSSSASSSPSSESERKEKRKSKREIQRSLSKNKRREQDRMVPSFNCCTLTNFLTNSPPLQYHFQHSKIMIGNADRSISSLRAHLLSLRKLRILM